MSERDNRMGTHATDCWSWGHGHYECAVARIETLGIALEADEAEITALRTRLSSAEAERDRLREGLEPFAEAAEAYPEMNFNGNEHAWSAEHLWASDRSQLSRDTLFVSDFRRARALLTPADGTETR